MVVLASVAALVPEVDVSHVGHASTSCLMSLLMPGQYMHCLSLYWHFDVPKCP